MAKLKQLQLDCLKKFISQKYPFWQETFKSYPIEKELFFKNIISLDKQVFKTCHQVIKTFWNLRENLSYQKYVKKQSSINYDPGHYSILMCYDFHIMEEEDKVKLIEINTNASFAMIIGILNQQHQNALPFYLFEYDYDGHKFFKNAICEEMRRFGINPRDHINIAILDNDPQTQKAYFEFHYYKALFEYWGWTVFICDPSDLKWKSSSHTLHHTSGHRIHFIYNRCCDFLLEKLEHWHLQQAFISGGVCFSPNPYEYSLLADKQRFIDICCGDFLNKINVSREDQRVLREAIPYSISVLSRGKKDLWSERKKWIFKPKSLYGSKGVFRGSSISKNKFESIYNEKFMAQEYIPAPLFEGYKYDLRIYTYKSYPYLVAARVYQGQVTNIHTGGFALVNFK